MFPKLLTVTVNSLSAYCVPGVCKSLYQEFSNFMCIRFAQGRRAGPWAPISTPFPHLMGGAPQSFIYVFFSKRWRPRWLGPHLGNNASGKTRDCCVHQKNTNEPQTQRKRPRLHYTCKAPPLMWKRLCRGAASPVSQTS